MIRGAVFDVDHTLFDRYATLCEILPGARERFALAEGVTDAQLTSAWIAADKKYVHFGWKRMFGELAKTGVFAPPAPSPEELGAFLWETFARVAVPFPYTRPTLEELRRRGLRLAVITNGKSALQRKKLEMIGLDGFFDEVIVSEEVGIDKPDPEIFHIMARRLGLPEKELCYVGDSEENDVKGSRAAGYTPVWIRTTGSWEFPEIPMPRLRINALYELLDYDFDTLG